VGVSRPDGVVHPVFKRIVGHAEQAFSNWSQSSDAVIGAEWIETVDMGVCGEIDSVNLACVHIRYEELVVYFIDFDVSATAGTGDSDQR